MSHTNAQAGHKVWDECCVRCVCVCVCVNVCVNVFVYLTKHTTLERYKHVCPKKGAALQKKKILYLPSPFLFC